MYRMPNQLAQSEIDFSSLAADIHEETVKPHPRSLTFKNVRRPLEKTLKFSMSQGVRVDEFSNKLSIFKTTLPLTLNVSRMR